LLLAPDQGTIEGLGKVVSLERVCALKRQIVEATPVGASIRKDKGTDKKENQAQEKVMDSEQNRSLNVQYTAGSLRVFESEVCQQMSCVMLELGENYISLEVLEQTRYLIPQPLKNILYVCQPLIPPHMRIGWAWHCRDCTII
jgi:thiazole synthase ThiGH ThiG subunit